MPETLMIEFVEDIFTHVTKRGMPQVMAQGDCLGQVLIQVQGSRYGAGYLGNLQGMGEPGYIMVTQGGDEDLCLVLEPPERFAVYDAVAVTLKDCPYMAGLFGSTPAL